MLKYENWTVMLCLKSSSVILHKAQWGACGWLVVAGWSIWCIIGVSGEWKAWGVDSKYTVNFLIMSLQVAGDRAAGYSVFKAQCGWKGAALFLSLFHTQTHKKVFCQSIPMFFFPVIACLIFCLCFSKCLSLIIKFRSSEKTEIHGEKQRGRVE